MRRGDDRGIVVVETALILPLLLFLLIGIAEFGITWRASNSAASTVRAAVLEESRGGNDRLIDLRMLERVRSTVHKLDALEWVMVYRVGPAAPGTPPVACTAKAEALTSGTDGILGVCTVFHASFVASASAADFVDPVCASEPDQYLCPSTRETVFGPDDRVGVAVRIGHDWLTGLLPGGGIQLDDHSVAYRLPGLEALS